MDGKVTFRGSRLRKVLPRFLLPALILFTLLATISCASSDKSSVPQELTISERLWKDQGLSDYDFTLTREAFAPEDWRGPVNIQVRDGTAVSVTYVSNGEAVTEGKFDNANTIDKLFTMLKNAYSGKGEFEQEADTINVTYNTQMGYPTNFYIDVSELMADEEQGYTVTDLVAQRLLNDRSSVPQELTISERLWKDQGLSDYDFTLTREAFAPEDWRGPVNIQVRDGTAVSVT